MTRDEHRELETRGLPAIYQPAAEWPMSARIIKRLRSPEDTGVGDTIQRQLGAPGRWFKQAAESLGANCGCANRQAWLNRRYPYLPP